MFIKRRKEEAPEKKPKKRKILKVTGIVLAVVLIIAGSFVAYLLATGSKIFENPTSSLFKVFNSDLTGFEEERVNILVMGRGGDNHPGGLLTDSLMVVSIKPEDKKIAMISIPRDLIVPIKDHGQDKINSSFADGYNDYMSSQCKKKNVSSCHDDAFAAGANLTRETAANILGINIKYHVTVDFDGFIKLVDALGGIDVTVDKTLYDPLFPDKNMKGYEPFYIKAGEHHMNGATALKYARSRETTSDFDRSSRQQKIIQAMKEKALSSDILTNPKKITEFTNIVGDHIRTNMSPAELKSLTIVLKDFDSSKMISKVLTNGNDGLLYDDSSTGTYYLKPKGDNFNKVKDFANDIFNEDEASVSESKIEVLNGTSTSGLAAKVSGELIKLGFEIDNVGTAEAKYQNTVIYDYSNGKNQKDIATIKKSVDGDVIKKTKPSGSEVDISIVIGADYM